MAEAQGITCLQPLRSAPLERAPAPSPQSHRPQAAPTPSKETGGSKSSSVAGCFSAPTCAFLPPCSQIHSERHGFSSGSGPARGDGGIGQFQWPCACVGENQNASRERERGLPDLMRLFARFCREKKVGLFGGKTQSWERILGLRWWPWYGISHALDNRENLQVRPS
jgi:hypothetical protein